MRYKTLKSIILTMIFGAACVLGIAAYDNEVKADAAVKSVEQNSLLRTVNISSDKEITVSEQLKDQQENGNYGSKNATLSRGGTVGDDIVTYAFKFMGKPYVWGASGPNAFDCSGFTAFVYSRYGVGLDHSAEAQFYAGTSVSRENLRPGDLVFFNTYTTLGHVGMYIGGGQFIHASSGSHRITVSSLGESYYSSRYAGAKRYIK
ncbi:MAG: C40 family peptidase [Solirubrobacterales bacterium]